MAVEIQSLSGYAGNTILCVNAGGTALECVPKSSFVSSVSPAFTGTPTAPTATVGTNTTQIATTAFVVAEIASRLAYADALRYKGAIDCSANPNYPAADAGDTYRVSVAGKIGGGSGVNVEAGDLLMCRVDSTSAGTQAAVGANWDVIQTNIDGAVTLTGTQTLTNKTLTTPTISGAITFPDGVRQTFNPNGTTPGLNVGSHTADPSTPSNGDLWYNSTSNQLKAYINGASVALGAGGSTYNESNPIYDSTSNELLKFVRVASAVNEVSISNNTTGNPPIISATGGDTNIDLRLEAKGTGKIVTPNSINLNLNGSPSIGNDNFGANKITFANNGTVAVSSGAGVGTLLSLAQSLSGSSVQRVLDLTQTIGQSGAGGYDLVYANMTHSSNGTGQRNFINFRIGSATRFRVTDDVWAIQKEASANPTSTDLTAGDHFAMYRKADKFIIAHNNGGTMTYLSINLDGSATTWTQSTTAP